MSIAVLGASGFIGSHVAKSLIASGEEVLVVASREPSSVSRREIWESASQRVVADLRQTRADLHGCTVVYNFAADMGGVGYFSDAQIAPYLSNSRITFNVIEMCHSQKVEKAFFASSACAYPTTIQMSEGYAPLLTEDLLEMGPADQMYGREKLMICAIARHLNFDCRVGILHTIYGDQDLSDPVRMKFPTAIAHKVIEARTSKKVEVWGNGKQLRSYLWIDDAVSKILTLMSGVNPGPINIGYQGAISVLDVLNLCARHLGVSPEIVTNSQKPSGVLARDCSNAKFWNLYGNLEPTNYQSGFGKLLDSILND